MDNLAPSGPTMLTAQVIAGPAVKLTWDKNRTDPDVGLYEVHRSTTSGFTPSPSTKVGESTDTTFTDGSPVTNQTNYYRIVTLDIYGNRSTPSPQASAALQVTKHYNVNKQWNMISVPLAVNDYAKTVLYPTAVSDAFSYEGTYVQKSTLANGVGYWLKFADNDIVSMTGFLLTTDSIDVIQGWNLIGSISEPVDVSTIISDPPGLVTSLFYGYQDGYIISSSIEPGKGYWVKVNQSGKLILSSTVVSSSQAIRIIPTDELLPPPPNAENHKSTVSNSG